MAAHEINFGAFLRAVEKGSASLDDEHPRKTFRLSDFEIDNDSDDKREEGR